MRLTEERSEEALHYLMETDEECAILKTETERRDYKAKAVQSAIFKRSSGTVAERQALAECSDEYDRAMEDYFNALQAFEVIKNKRFTEEKVWDTWRTIQANQRRGNV